MMPWEREAHFQRLHAMTGGRVGLMVRLPTGVFWSQGWKGCDRCGGSCQDRVDLERFVERDGNVIRSGWRCRSLRT